MDPSTKNISINVTIPTTIDPDEARMLWVGTNVLWTLFPVVIGIVTIILSIFLIATIFRNKEFNTGGYYLLVDSSICQLFGGIFWYCVYSCGLALIHRFYRVPAFTGAKLSTVLTGVCSDAGFFAALMAFNIISVQRFCAVWFYKYYQRIFNNNRTITIVSVLFTWIFGLGIAVPMYSGPVVLYVDIYDLSWGGNYENEITLAYVEFFVWLPMASFVFMIFIYAAIGYKLRTIRNKTKKAVGPESRSESSDSKKWKEEAMLCLQFFIVSFVYLLPGVGYYAVTNLIDFTSLTREETEWVRIVEVFTWTVGYCNDPFIHLSLNKRLRRATITTVKCWFIPGYAARLHQDMTSSTGGRGRGTISTIRGQSKAAKSGKTAMTSINRTTDGMSMSMAPVG